MGNFARTGDPNGPGLPRWPCFAPTDPVPYVQSLAPGPGGIRFVDLVAGRHLDLWVDLLADET